MARQLEDGVLRGGDADAAQAYLRHCQPVRDLADTRAAGTGLPTGEHEDVLGPAAHDRQAEESSSREGGEDPVRHPARCGDHLPPIPLGGVLWRCRRRALREAIDRRCEPFDGPAAMQPAQQLAVPTGDRLGVGDEALGVERQPWDVCVLVHRAISAGCAILCRPTRGGCGQRGAGGAPCPPLHRRYARRSEVVRTSLRPPLLPQTQQAEWRDADEGCGGVRAMGWRGVPVWDDRPVVRGDGQLTHDILPGEKGPQDACGVFGVWAPGEEVAKLTYFGLYALQHRGQESAGIATSNGNQILVFKDMGLVSQVFDDASLRSLTGHIALGHVRYATTGRSVWENAQPTLGPTAAGTIALGHNGNLINTTELIELISQRYGPSVRQELTEHPTDTAVLTALLSGNSGQSLEDTAVEVLPRVRGAYSLAFIDEHGLYAARDPQGIRPLVLGRLERGWVVASETAGLDIIGASLVREVEPGELIIIDADGLRSRRFAG